MTVGEAKAIARRWVEEHAGEVPGLHGVFIAGSLNWRPEEEEYDPLSDIDLYHVIQGKPDPAPRQRKLIHEGVLLEPSYHPYESFADAEKILGSWIYAAHLSVPSVIVDPSGHLTAIQKAVEAHYAEPEWVRKRCGNVETAVRTTWIPRMTGGATLNDLLVGFGFVPLTIAQIPLIASVKPPTIRRSGMLFSEKMKSLGHEPLGELLLVLIGSARMGMAEVERFFQESTAAYDRALEVHRKPVAFDFDLYPASRHMMIQGGRDLIDRGFHREAMWWIFIICYVAHNALEADAPEEWERVFRLPYQRLLDTLGIGSLEAVAAKAPLAEDLLSRTMAVAGEIMKETYRKEGRT